MKDPAAPTARRLAAVAGWLTTAADLMVEAGLRETALALS